MEDEYSKIIQEKDKAFSRDQIKFISQQETSLRNQALFSILYLTNSRVSEITKRLRKNQIEIKNMNSKRYILFKDLHTEKNRQHPLRNIPVLIEKEHPMADIVLKYIELYNDNNLLFPISRQRAWQIIKKMCGQRCHYLRHSRLTHLMTEYGIGEVLLSRMAGWKDTRMATTYVHLSWQDAAEMML